MRVSRFCIGLLSGWLCKVRATAILVSARRELEEEFERRQTFAATTYVVLTRTVEVPPRPAAPVSSSTTLPSTSSRLTDTTTTPAATSTVFSSIARPSSTQTSASSSLPTSFSPSLSSQPHAQPNTFQPTLASPSPWPSAPSGRPDPSRSAQSTLVLPIALGAAFGLLLFGALIAGWRYRWRRRQWAFPFRDVGNTNTNTNTNRNTNAWRRLAFRFHQRHRRPAGVSRSEAVDILSSELVSPTVTTTSPATPVAAAVVASRTKKVPGSSPQTNSTNTHTGPNPGPSAPAGPAPTTPGPTRPPSYQSHAVPLVPRRGAVPKP
uniref:Uncharacterized protein n=1 Tax=Mycena chlorophos TaxID=658473 RepID=A0ABQ0LR36_MYCCL|nr:predicted protein [Mycena chlorophos]